MSQSTQAASLAQYEEQAFALYFLNDIRYPYVSVTLMTLVAVWLLHGKVGNGVIALWVGVGIGSSVLRELFVRHMKPRLAEGRGHAMVLRGFAASSLATGLVWGAFAVMYFDPADPMTVLVVSSYVAGHVGGAVTPLSIYLPAFHLFV
ncbi:MAG: hypothetical protein WEK74_00585, partial [Hydrogenophaga sp.]